MGDLLSRAIVHCCICEYILLLHLVPHLEIGLTLIELWHKQVKTLSHLATIKHMHITHSLQFSSFGEIEAKWRES